MSENVVSLFGGPTSVREVDENAVAVLERYLELARAGEVVGATVAVQHYDGTSEYQIGGRIGTHALLGAVTRMQFELVDLARDE